MITHSRRNTRALLVGLCGLLLASSPGPIAGADLDDYVRQHDAVFSWKQTSNHTTAAGTFHTLDFSSQVWQGITWNHELTIYEPTDLIYQDTMLLFITGGRTGGKSNDDDHKQAFALTRVTGARSPCCTRFPTSLCSVTRPRTP